MLVSVMKMSVAVVILMSVDANISVNVSQENFSVNSEDIFSDVGVSQDYVSVDIDITNSQEIYCDVNIIEDISDCDVNLSDLNSNQYDD